MPIYGRMFVFYILEWHLHLRYIVAEGKHNNNNTNCRMASIIIIILIIIILLLHIFLCREYDIKASFGPFWLRFWGNRVVSRVRVI